ncbi:MAG: hypothetical protein V8R82_00670 [Clostridia bacterium]
MHHNQKKKNEELKPQNLDLNSLKIKHEFYHKNQKMMILMICKKELEAKFDELFGPIEDDDE